MRIKNLFLLSTSALLLISFVTVVWAAPAKMTMTTNIPVAITTPDKVQTSIGTLKFFDGVPTKDTVDTVYDYVDRGRSKEVSINMIPAVSMPPLRQGQRDIAV